MKISMIASGSKGNCCYIESENSKILIDCGISFKRIESFFVENGIDMNIDAMFITHEHVDHVTGLKMFGKKIGCPVYMTAGTRRGMIEKYTKNGENPLDFNDVKIISNIEQVYIKDITIKAFPISHDVYDPIGFVITDSERKLVYITDTGIIPQRMYGDISDADVYVMETNHDPVLLMSCEKRPYDIRIRILGDEGHLSNEDGLNHLANIMGENTKLVFYAHISDDCNLWNIIEETAKRVYKSAQIDVSNIRFVYTSQIPTEVFEV